MTKPMAQVVGEAKREDDGPELLHARQLLDDGVSLERAWRELNDERSHATPQVTIESIMYCVRQRGLAAPKEPANLERLPRCDAAAKAQIDRRIEKLIAAKEIGHD